LSLVLTTKTTPKRVAVLDAGGQYVDLVQKAVERQGIPADVLSLQTPVTEIEASYDAIIISGSPASSHAQAAPLPDPLLWGTKLPILGICYGMQSMAMAHGGSVSKNIIREDGRVITTVDTSHPIFQGIKQDFMGLFTHGDFVTTVPEGFTAIGQHKLSDGATAYSAIASGNKIGVQFHPEVFDDTPEGYQLFKNFLHGVAGIAANPSFQEERLSAIIANKRRAIKHQVGDRHVIAFVSGGVDSSVAATLASAVVDADKFHAFYIDSGFMRDEDDLVIEMLQAVGMSVTKVDATKQFEEATIILNGATSVPLSQTDDPETKRKIIGKTFITIQNDLLASLKLDEALLLQGTNAADRIESGHSKGDSHTETIKTHHNQVAEVQELKARGLLVEPIDDLFKDEIRAIGRELGLPDELVERQPFPGPGTAIRIICAPEDKTELEAAPETKALNEFVTNQNLKAYILPVRSVGVGGDERSHISVAAIEHASLTSDGMATLATDIPAHFRGVINRVVYALGEQSLADGSVTKTLLTADSRAQLRIADKIVFEVMRAHDVMGKIKQMPVVLLPLSFDKPGDRSIVLRPVTTSTFMTVQAILPGRDLPQAFFDDIVGRIISEVPGISQVFLDLTNKPPGTTEWE
jgi:GMP synthase (glutamine-hydrolysing)